MDTIKQRKDFLRATASGHKCVTGCLILQMAPARAPDTGAVRIGYTVTKKLGGAVARNRIKRRLREAVRQVFPQRETARLQHGRDYVIIARKKALLCPYSELLRDMRYAFARLGAFSQTATPTPNQAESAKDA